MRDYTETQRDVLTHCYTREGLSLFFDKLGVEYLSSRKPFSLLLLDIDHFKQHNDKYGHHHGDQVLQYFSSSLNLGFPDPAIQVFRLGGDEFVVVFPSKAGAEAFRLSSKLKENLQTRRFMLKGRQYKVHFSGGIATYPRHGETLEELLKSADRALYCAKRHGRNLIIQREGIWLESAKQILAVLVFLAVGFGGFYLSREELFGAIGHLRQRGSKAALPEHPGTYTIRLKSGAVLEGVTVDRMEEDGLWVKVRIDRSEGLVLVKYSDMLKMEREEAHGKSR